MKNDFELFRNTTLASVFKDIYTNSKKKDRQINLLIADLKPLVKNIEDAIVVIPLIKDYLDLSVKNDDHLIKLAAIVQRLMTSSTSAESSDMPTLSDAEMEEIKKELEKLETENRVIKKESTKKSGED